MSPDDPLDSTSDDGADRPATGPHERLVHRPDMGSTSPDMGSPSQDDVDDLDGWHTFPAAIDTGDGVERTVVILRCSHLAYASRETLEQLGRLGPWPSITSCSTCTPDVPDGVPTWLTE